MRRTEESFHYAAARREIRKRIANIELARELHGTPIERLCRRILDEWRNPRPTDEDFA